ncbi:MAG TPA: D-aminoacylase [Dissulfurispiraceae bacterium]|nr:D-aminoacylase [Dissulfurispiraceae bacterium]
MFDLLIANGQVIDGSGLTPKQMHVGITGDVITYVGPHEYPAHQVIDAKGLAVAPGFIDTHAHSEFTLLADGSAEGKIAQGVTTEVNGNCGLSAAPLYGEYLERREADIDEYGITERWQNFSAYFKLLEQRGIALNFTTLCGHGNVRGSVVGYTDRPATADELAIMQDMVADAVRSGARGISTGLIYPPGIYATAEEVVAVTRTAVQTMKGRLAIYATHLRSEGDWLLESIDEAFDIGKKSGASVHISHLKTAGEENWHKIDAALAQIKAAFRTGMLITADCYPYIASSTDLDTVLPKCVYDGGAAEEIARLQNSDTRRRILGELQLHPPQVWERIQVSKVIHGHNEWMEGERFSAIAARLGKPPAEALLDVLIDEEARTRAIFFSMCEENLQRFLQLPYLMFGSDSAARSFSGVTAKGKPHPRGFGSFPRLLARYVREQNLMPLQNAIRRMTSVPAYTFGIEKRGTVRPGYFADIVVFDAYRIEDRADFRNPFQRPKGIVHVIVNGQTAMLDGELTGTRAGRILR